MPFLALDPADAAVLPPTTIGAPLNSVGMTLAELRGRLNLQLGGRPDVTPPMLDQWINAAYLDICSSLEVEELKKELGLDLVVAQPMYLLPRTIRAIRYVSVVDAVTYGELGGRKLSLSDLTNYRRSPDRSDEPEEFFREGQILVIYPTPSNVRSISLDVWVRPDKLALDTDSPILSEEWHEIILRNARQMAHSDLREWESSALSKNEFVSLVRQKNTPEELEEEDKIVGSSVPRRRRQLFRRNSMPRTDRDGLC